MGRAVYPRTRRPFRSTPNTECYFPSAVHESALSALRSAYENQDGIALVDGEPGTGKTLIGLRFLESFPNEVSRILIPAARFSRPSDLFQSLLFDFDVPYQGLSEQELRLAVTDRLLKEFATGFPTVIVLDEAQHLGAELLEELRLLGNIGTRSTKATFFVLLALPSLRERLTRPESAAFAQRLAVRPRLEPLSSEESTEFLRNQLQSCGLDCDEAISMEALSLLATHGRGVPRLLNQAAALAFQFTQSAEEPTVDVEAVMEALTQLGLMESASEETPVLPHLSNPTERLPVNLDIPTEVTSTRTTKPRAPKRRSA